MEDKKKSPKISKPAGRPDGSSGIPQQNRKTSPVGGGETSGFSLDKIKENMILAQKLETSIQGELRKVNKLKRLNKTQKQVAAEICTVIVSNEKPEDWIKSVKKYCKSPIDTNKERVQEVMQIAATHGIDTYLASLLASSLSTEK